MQSRVIKVLLVGDTLVGKSSIVLRYADKQFSGTYTKTIGIDFKIVSEKKDNKEFKFQIWDTSGLAQYEDITTAYYRGAEYFILVVDDSVDDIAQYVNQWHNRIQTHSINQWNNRIQTHSNLQCQNNIIVAVNVKSELGVSELEQLQKKCEALDFQYIFVNPKSDTSVEINKLFNEMILNRVIEANAKLLAAQASAAASSSSSESKGDSDEIDRILSDYLNPLKYLFTHHWKRISAVRAAFKKMSSPDDKLKLVDNQLDLLEGKAVLLAPFTEKTIDPRWTTQAKSDSTKNFDKSGAYQTLFSVREKLNSNPNNVRTKKMTLIEEKERDLRPTQK